MTALITDIDGTLVGDAGGLNALNEYISARRKAFYLVYATGRCLEEYLEVLGRGILILPDAAIINTGADILVNTGNKPESVKEWHAKIGDVTWRADKVIKALSGVDGITTQLHLSENKVCYFVDPAAAGEAGARVKAALKKAGIKAKVIISHGKYIDILPEKCDKGEAAAFLIKRAGIKNGDVITAGDSENDLDLFMKFKRGIVVSNALEKLKSSLKGKGFYFAGSPCAAGILEGLKHYLL
jgi:sucrose-phosphate synthase